MKILHLLPRGSKNKNLESDHYLSENIIPGDIKNESNKNIMLMKIFWSSKQKIKNFEKICSDTYEKSLKVLCKYLNEIHNQA